MFYYILVRNSDGYIKQTGSASTFDELLTIEGYTSIVIPSSINLSTNSYKWDSSLMQLVEIPPRPSPMHEWEMGQWNDTSSVEQKWEQVREIRNAILSATDWIVTRSAERGISVPSDVAIYREALRNITAQSDPFNINWPAAPAVFDIGPSAPITREI